MLMEPATPELLDGTLRAEIPERGQRDHRRAQRIRLTAQPGEPPLRQSRIGHRTVEHVLGPLPNFRGKSTPPGGTHLFGDRPASPYMRRLPPLVRNDQGVLIG
ncbi:hypothetical protein AB0K60_04975 [Thermopolyspora sp. NPDC052614]|uniref:hypothetical protein n=1 Tax=Thermopolyspora sp. NPDC052614 TaxID=3155682 RepID=UPI0034482113